MKCLLLGDQASDFGQVLESCGAEITRMTFEEAQTADLSPYGSFCVFGENRVLSPRLRVRLEAESCKAGKRILTEALGSWGDFYCAPPADDTAGRLVCVCGPGDDGIPGLAPGDLLDDGSNRLVLPYYATPGMKPLLVYKDHVPAHLRWADRPADLQNTGKPALWTVGEHTLSSAFVFHNFNRARFAPAGAWRKLIAFLAAWLTGQTPARFPAPVVRYGATEALSDDAAFERCRKNAVDRGIRWLRQYLINDGHDGIREGLRHNVSPEGAQETADCVRTDCCGEAAGAFRFHGRLTGAKKDEITADNLFGFVFGPMAVKGGLFDGMLRWTDTGWSVCYQDDAARAMLPALYDCLLFGNDAHFPAVCRALDFLVKTTAKDGCRKARTDAPFLDKAAVQSLAAAEHGHPSAHYNAYYHAALLLAYRCGGNETYLATARRGLETLMALYPDTCREQSETEELCRLILPLSLLYRATGEEKHRAMLYRVADDLEQRRHPFGGFCEWDTGYKAACARNPSGECSLLTENGDPVADLLYSVNWLPVGFAFAHRVTGDPRFYNLWREAAAFCLKTQVFADDPRLDGCWCRAFDMDLREAYANPHDAGWAAKCSESGWTNAEILMGLMLPEIFEQKK